MANDLASETYIDTCEKVLDYIKQMDSGEVVRVSCGDFIMEKKGEGFYLSEPAMWAAIREARKSERAHMIDDQGYCVPYERDDAEDDEAVMEVPDEQLEPGYAPAIAKGCTCWTPYPAPDAIDPPEVRINKTCPLHGQPDREHERE